MPNGFREQKAPSKKDLATTQKSMLDRITDLEKGLSDTANAVNTIVGQIVQRLANCEETLSAVVESAGSAEIQAIVRKNRIQALEKRDGELREMIEKALLEGQIESADVVTDGSVIVGVEKDSSGVPLPPGRVQLAYVQVAPEFQKELLGKAVGAVITTHPGKDIPDGTFEVTEIYIPVAPKVPQDGE